jgi:hypothetical protein
VEMLPWGFQLGARRPRDQKSAARPHWRYCQAA